ncbi:MAG: undecaprenyldiphospho-muramoylpentapeptide beta-N-acetylglucosaminyltransferase [Clostridiales bacterium]|nr:undecaprenyldiphospho-muramoylpentapeptide beta-N-acetylglucosaminyltransferase [Clostridiales bacterium]
MKVLFAGGGTGGHINPAISIADYAKNREKNFEAVFIGTKTGLETRLVPKAGYKLEFIDIEGFDRRHLLKNAVVLKKLVKARADAKRIIRDFKPDCVVCTGGYVSGPVMMAAKAMGVPSLIHEQNVYPGLTVKGSEKYADYLALSFEETISSMKAKEKCVVTGNPVRSEILNADRDRARKKLGIKKPFVLIFGGSLGADRINDTVIKMLPKAASEGKIELLFGTGERNYDKIMDRADKNALSEDIKIVPYIDNMADCMAAADIVVSRAGAITVSEIAALAKPSILIPSPNVVRNHQEQNAREFERNGAAEVILESGLDENVLYDKIISMLENPKKLSQMSQNLKKLAVTDALERIYALMVKMCTR